MRPGKRLLSMPDHMNSVHANVGLVMEGTYYRITDLRNLLYDLKNNLLLHDLKITERLIFPLEKKYIGLTMTI